MPKSRSQESRQGSDRESKPSTHSSNRSTKSMPPRAVEESHDQTELSGSEPAIKTPLDAGRIRTYGNASSLIEYSDGAESQPTSSQSDALESRGPYQIVLPRSPTPSMEERKRHAKETGVIEGFFWPPGGRSYEPLPFHNQFFMWATLPPPDEPGTDINERDTPSPPPEQVMVQAKDSLGTPTEQDRDMFNRGPANDWRQWPHWPDSRDRYPGPVFPEPRGGFSEGDREQVDFHRAVVDFWAGHHYSSLELKTYVWEGLWKQREKEKMEYWIQFKLPEGLHRGVDLRTADPKLMEWARSVGAPGADQIVEKGSGEKSPWNHQDIEPGQSANPDWQYGLELQQPGTIEEAPYDTRKRSKAIVIPVPTEAGEPGPTQTGSEKAGSTRSSAGKASIGSGRSSGGQASAGTQRSGRPRK